MPNLEPFTDHDRELLPDLIESGQHRSPLLATVTLLLALVLVAVGAPEPRPHPAPAATPSPTGTSIRPSPVTLSEPPVTLDLPTDVVAVDVGPTGYLAVVAVDCPEERRCEGSMAVSEDRRHWTRRQLPSAVLRSGMPTPTVIGHGVLLVETEVPLRRWHSRDGGRTWRSVPDGTATAASDAGPGRLTVDLSPQASQERPCDSSVVSVIRRDTGQRAPLRTQPDLVACRVTPFPDPAGRLWVAGFEPGTRRPALAMSTDLGRTWHTTSLPDAGIDRPNVSVGYAGSHVYALVAGYGPVGTRFGIFRYEPAGWALLGRTGELRIGPVNQPVICPDGLLFVYSWEELRLLASRDHGRSWHATDGPAVLGYSVRHQGSTAWLGWIEGRRPAFSLDCRNWETLTVQ